MPKKSKKLTRSNSQRIVFGVCGGLGEYFGMNPIIFRLIFIVLTIFFASGALIYLLAALILPPEKF